MYNPIITLEEDFHLVEPGFAVYKKICMLQLHCTATSAARKKIILNEFNITPENDPDEYEYYFNDDVLKKVIEAGSGDIKQVLTDALKSGAVAGKVKENFGIEKYLVELFRSLFIESGEAKYKKIKADALNMRELKVAEHDFFLIATGQSESLLMRSNS